MNKDRNKNKNRECASYCENKRWAPKERTSL